MSLELRAAGRPQAAHARWVRNSHWLIAARPQSFSLDDLKRFPSQTQITKLVCEEGWSAIAEWTGVSLRRVLEVAGIRPTARFVQFYAMDDVADELDLLDALHPQTILAYGMKGRDLPHPLVRRCGCGSLKQLGCQSVKFLSRIVVTDEFDDPGKLGPLGAGFSWHAGI